jgi:transcriptional regulator
MYIPKANQEHDTARIVHTMRAYNFAIFTSLVEGELMATHLPIITVQEGERIICRGHFARANPQWRSIQEQRNLLIFSGPHAYISPTHYEKEENVPTWNYIAIHAYGRARLVEEPAALEALLAELIMTHEAPYQAQWTGLSERYRQGMMQGIVGFELVVEQLEGKAKLSQNRSVTEQVRVAEALLGSPHEVERATGAAMRGVQTR